MLKTSMNSSPRSGSPTPLSSVVRRRRSNSRGHARGATRARPRREHCARLHPRGLGWAAQADQAVVLVVRQDSSGTTYAFTKHSAQSAQRGATRGLASASCCSGPARP
jgi:hypothetical protein